MPMTFQDHRTGLTVFLLTTFMLAAIPISRAQIFARLTEGPVVTDVNDSRSVNWIDEDGDGDLDLFVTNSSGQNSKLYRNQGDGTFVGVLGDPLTSSLGRSDGASWADADGDGDLDVFVVNWYGDENQFFLNNGDGSYTRVLDGPHVNDSNFSETCNWLDIDADGDLDLYVTNSAGDLQNDLYLNDGTGQFVQEFVHATVLESVKARGVTWCDFTGDQLPDLFVTNEDDRHNLPFINQGDGSFALDTESALYTDTYSTMTASWGDFDNDGDLDVFCGNHGGDPNQLFVNDGSGGFTLHTGNTFPGEGGRTFGSAWGDYDNDGDLDLAITEGYSSQTLTNHLYENIEGTFERRDEEPISQVTGWGYGVAWADYDMDGDLDLAIARWEDDNQANLLFRNDQDLANAWLQLNVQGQSPNTTAVGTVVRVWAVIGGETVEQMRVVEGQTGYCGQSLRLHVGLGDATVVDSLAVSRPDGTEDVYGSLPVNQIMTIGQAGNWSEPNNGRSSLPTDMELYPVYPNPFNDEAVVRFTIDETDHIDLDLLDLLGRKVLSIADGLHMEGVHVKRLPGQDLAGGTYFVRLRAGERTQVRRAVLLR
ncbi:T9SS type A sorting domain-containing protein [bacterium]|nr:T9SS type A sorting domain-containing protein [bacterium]